jgi:hypothetical protein
VVHIRGSKSGSKIGVYIGGPYWGSILRVQNGVHIRGPKSGSILGVQNGSPYCGSILAVPNRALTTILGRRSVIKAT